MEIIIATILVVTLASVFVHLMLSKETDQEYKDKVESISKLSKEIQERMENLFGKRK